MRGRGQSGFTLLELIVAVVLTAVLAVAVATVLRSVLREQKNDSADRSPIRQLGISLRHDLINARFYRAIDGGIQLLGPIALDAQTNQSLQVEAEVTWGVRTTRLGSLLIRRQSISNYPMPNSQTNKPVWLGVAEVRFSTTYIDAAPTLDHDPVLQASAVADGWNLLPPSFKVDLLTETGSILFSESIARLR